MTQRAFHVNLDLCTGCKACQVACKDKNDLPVGRTWRRVVEYTGGSWVRNGRTVLQDVFAYYVSVSCNHCENAACVNVCPSGAMTKRADGVVLVDQEKCLGCRYCSWACPYDAPQFDEATGLMTKCNFCADYLDQNQPPACVAACPSRALDYGELEELRAKYGTANELAPLPSASLTKPSLILTPNRNAQPGNVRAGSIANVEEL